MKDFVLILDDVLSPTFCQQLIQKFERNESHEQERTSWENRQFMEVNITTRLTWEDENAVLTNVVQKFSRIYADRMGIVLGSQWPTTFGYEQFRMKRYLPNGVDQFAFHTDVGSHASSRRFLAFLWYLNDVKEGGMTKFANSSTEPPFLEVQAKTGRVLMFPPLWTHPHWGEKPVSGPKYIISSYLHYL